MKANALILFAPNVRGSPPPPRPFPRKGGRGKRKGFATNVTDVADVKGESETKSAKVPMWSICKVEAAFSIVGRGVGIEPGCPIDSTGRLRLGDRVLLRRPDGTEMETAIAGIGSRSFDEPPEHPMTHRVLLLGPALEKREVPVGTEVFAI